MHYVSRFAAVAALCFYHPESLNVRIMQFVKIVFERQGTLHITQSGWKRGQVNTRNAYLLEHSRGKYVYMRSGSVILVFETR